jgi:ComF family protein
MIPLLNYSKPFLASLLDIVYPPYCLRCYKSLINKENKFVCPECLLSAEKMRIDPENICLKCGMALGPHSGQRDICPSCDTMHFPFKRNIAFGRYEESLRDLILIYKYGGEKALTKILAGFLIERLKKESGIISKINLLMPVPLTRRKKKIRGFNQSELIARILAEEFNLPLSINNLVRIKELPPQAALSRAERINNLKDAFDVLNNDELKNKTILVVDDVLTTGATAGEISRTLKKAGAASVYISVLAR